MIKQVRPKQRKRCTFNNSYGYTIIKCEGSGDSRRSSRGVTREGETRPQAVLRLVDSFGGVGGRGSGEAEGRVMIMARLS